MSITGGIEKSHSYIWDTNTLSWIPWDGSVSGGGGGGGGPATIADGADVNAGATSDAAVITNTTGTLSGKLRGIIALLLSVINSGKVSVDGSGVTQPVSGPLTDAQLRAAPVLTTPDPASNRTATGTVTADDETVQIEVAGYAGLGVIATGIFGGTLFIEFSVDGGITWTGGLTYNQSNNSFINDIDLIDTAYSVILNGGTTHVRVRGFAWSSGTATVSFCATEASTPFGYATVLGDLPLPPDAATASHQTDASQKTQVVDGSGNVISSTGNALDVNLKTPATIPVSAASLPLPSGAATETTLGTRLSESDFDTKTGSLTETAPATDTASSGLNGRLQRIAQRLTSLLAAIGVPFQSGGSIGNTTFASTQGTSPWVVGQGTAASLNMTEASAASIKTAVEVIDNFISGSRGLVTEDNSASIKTAVEIIDNFISGSRGLVTEDNSAAIKTDADTIVTNTNTLVAAGAGGYVRQDSTATIAKESGGNLATLAAKDFSTQTTLAALLAALGISQGAVSTSQLGPMVQGLVADAPPSIYLDSYIQPLSLTQQGRLRVSSEPSVAATDFYGNPFEQDMLGPSVFDPLVSSQLLNFYA